MRLGDQVRIIEYQVNGERSHKVQLSLLGYSFRWCASDWTHNHGLDPKQPHLHLNNPQPLYSVESAALAPGYTIGRADL